MNRKMKKLFILSALSLLTISTSWAQCFSPSVAVLSNITETDVLVEWNDFAGASAFDVEIVAHGDPLSGAPVGQAVTSPYLWTGGSQGVVYDVYVRAHCPAPNEGTFSPYSGPVYFQTTPTECVVHTVFNPPLELTTDPNVDCESESDNLDLDDDGVDDLFLIVFDECIDPFYGTSSPSSVRLNGLGAEGVRFVSTSIFVEENGTTLNANGILPMQLGQVILTTELSGLPDVVNHGDDYDLWEGAGVRHVGFDVVRDGFLYSGWIKAEANDEYIKIYEAAFNNRIDDPMQVGQIDCVYCPADFDQDGFVEIDDFLALNSAFGTNCVCAEDLDGNGVVNINDFINFNSAFGIDCSTLFQDDLYRTSGDLIETLDNMPDVVLNEELAKVIDDLRAERELLVYPNPSNGEFLNFAMAESESYSGMGIIQVTDLAGKLVFEDRAEMTSLMNRGQLTFDTPLQQGFYVLSIQNSGTLISQRFVVD